MFYAVVMNELKYLYSSYVCVIDDIIYVASTRLGGTGLKQNRTAQPTLQPHGFTPAPLLHHGKLTACIDLFHNLC